MNLKKIISEELSALSESFPIIESNELDWIKNVDPMSGGEYFNDSKEICFGDSQRYCDVRINNKYITFYFSEDDFRELWDIHGDWGEDEWILRSLWENGTPYDGDNDYYELDLDEFNYSYYSFSDNHIDRFNEILRTVGSGDSVDNFQDEMNSLMNVLKHPKIQYMFDNMANEYVNELGYIVQRNRWLAISDQWDEVTKKAGVGVNMLHDDIVIKIPIEKAHQKYYNNGVNDLTQLFKAIIEVLSDTNWYEWFMDGWDTDGGEDRIDTVLNNFLDKTEDYIESEGFEKWEKVLSDFEYLGIKNRQNSYRYNYHQLERENPNDNTIWIIILKGDYDKVDLKLYKKHSSTYYYRNEDVYENHYDVPLEEIPKYIKPLD